MLISKDEQNGFRACVLAIIPTNKSRQENKTLETKTFEGTILVYNQDESAFLFSMDYKKGKLLSVNRPTSNKGARASADCYSAIYQANAPNQVGGSSGGGYLGDMAEKLQVPMSFMDNGGNNYTLVDIIPADCSQGNPSGVPWSDPSNPNEANWVFPKSGGGSPWTGPSSGPGDGPVPIDEGQPIDLSPVDLWFWNMLHRIGGGISFNEDERKLIRNNYDLTYIINNYVQQNGRKPLYLEYLSLDVNNATESELLAGIGNLDMAQPGVPRGLSNAELTLLGYGSPSFNLNFRKYYKDAQDASLRTVRRYGWHDSMEDGLTRANGFKHALFQIYHCRSASFGRTLGAQLSQAHEGGGQNLDNQMDYWNNNQGLIIFDANPNASDDFYDNATFNAVNSGLMRYLKQGWQSTVMTPTNQ